MFGRQRSGSVLCPSCGSLVGVNDTSCLTCGRRRPGMWGFASLLRKTGDDMGFLTLVMFMCGALYIASLFASLSPGGGGVSGLLAPSGIVLARFGSTGAVPMFVFERWWSILSYGWLHGNAIHIAFNMMAARDLIPAVAHLYGPARTVIIYVVACATGALLSSAMGLASFLPNFLRGSYFTIGASGAIFGLVGALVYYSRRGGSRTLGEFAWRWVISGVIFGIAMHGRIDNWCHAGGFVGGYLASRVLDPLKPERGDHMIVAVVLLVASAASIVASLLVDVPLTVRG